MKYLFLALIFLLHSTSLLSQDKKKWDVANFEAEFREVEFSTNEGTWMNLDVSPDGKEIVFDLLGNIYIMPVTGGEATVLREGLPYEVQPRFSPDGKQISFTSDAGGGDNIWVMNRDGSNARQITTEDFRLLNNAVWTPDGMYLVARKHFTSRRSAGAGELWMYHVSGGNGMQLTEKKNEQQDAGEPWVSPDGRYVYFSEDMYPGGFFQYNKDPNSQIYIIRRYDREKGEIENIVTGPGGAVRPVLSRDGRKLAYVRRVRDKSVLFLHDLKSGAEKPLFDGLTKDQQEAWALFGVYTNFNFTPDDKHIIIWGLGKIWKVETATSKVEEIPFTALVNLKIAEALKFPQEVAPDSFTVRTIRNAVTSPDGKLLVFNAAGYIWKKDIPDGKPARITTASHFEFEPKFSADGRHIVYVSWDDEETGAIYTLDLNRKNARPTKITTRKGILRTPSFSPDGNWIVFRRERGNAAQGFTHTTNPGIYIIPVKGGEEKLITREGENPSFSADGKRIFYQTGGYLFGSFSKAFKSVDLNGNEEKTHFTSRYANQFVPSPDNNWILFNELFKVYVAPFPKTGKPIELTAKTKALPVAQVARDAGTNLHWSGDNRKIHWTMGEEYFTNELKDRFSFLDGSPDSIPPIDSSGLKIGLVLKTDRPEGKIAFTGARVITMNSKEEVIENGVIVVDGNRIIAVGKQAEVDIPPGTKVIDVEGKTIIPGIVDVHAHLGTFRFGLSPRKQWSYYANLAYGITTTHDPSSNSEMVFSQSEMVKAGHMIGPRIYSTGIILYGADGDFKAVVNNIEDARSAIRRTKAYGAFSVKSYNQPRRDQRQMIMQAAREHEMMVYPEGGSHFLHNMSMILDGHTGVEHNIPVAPVHNDVIQFWSASNTGYTPTLIVNYGGINGEYYWYQKTNVWEKERLLNFTPRAIVDSRSRHRTIIPDEEYEIGHIMVSRSCKKLSDAGVKVNVGGHGQLQGLGVHWEIWMLAQGGMSPMEALRAATMNGAEYIGMDKDLGSLEAGKLADLVVLDNNPLEDIHNTEFVRYTMMNGRLYDAESMNEVGNYSRKRSAFYWESGNSNSNFPFYQDTNSFDSNKCGCSGRH